MLEAERQLLRKPREPAQQPWMGVCVICGEAIQQGDWFYEFGLDRLHGWDCLQHYMLAYRKKA